MKKWIIKSRTSKYTGRKIRAKRKRVGYIGRTPSPWEVEKTVSLVNPNSLPQDKQIVNDWHKLFKQAKTEYRKYYCWQRINEWVASSWGILLKQNELFTERMIPKEKR